MVKREYLSNKICIYCGKEFSIRPKEKPYKFLRRKICSRQCNAKYVAKTYCTGKPAHNNNRVIRECKYCHKKELVSLSYASRPFCSRECMRKWYHEQCGSNTSHWQGGKLKRNCKVCGKEFEFDKGDLNRGPNSRLYCSIRCKAIDNMKKTKKRNTNIENILESWLIKNKIKYEPQKVISGVSIVDFFIYPNTCLYADGDYWHSFPKTQEKDKVQTEKLLQMGYKVIRLKGSEILKGGRLNEIFNTL